MDAIATVERAQDEAHEEPTRTTMALLVLLTRAVDLVLAVAKFNKLLQSLLTTAQEAAAEPDYRKTFLFLDVANLIARAKAEPGRIDLLDPALPKHHVLQAPEHTRANLLRAASGINDALALLVTEKPVPEPEPTAATAATVALRSAQPAATAAASEAEATYDDYASAGLVPVLVTHSTDTTEAPFKFRQSRVSNSGGRPVLLVPGAPLRVDREDALAALSLLTSPQSPFPYEALALRGHEDPFLAMLTALPKRTLFRFKVLLPTLVLYHEASGAWFYQIRINYDAAWAALHDSNRSKANSNSVDAVAAALTDHLDRKLAACVTLARVTCALSGGSGESAAGLVRYYVPATDCPSASCASSDCHDEATATEPRTNLKSKRVPTHVLLRSRRTRTGLGPYQ